jgi:hypothetical protein
MSRVTIKKINEAIAALGGEEQIFHNKQAGYYYFAEGTADAWREETGVYGIYRLNHMSLEQWIEVWKERRDRYLADK